MNNKSVNYSDIQTFITNNINKLKDNIKNFIDIESASNRLNCIVSRMDSIDNLKTINNRLVEILVLDKNIQEIFGGLMHKIDIIYKEDKTFYLEFIELSNKDFINSIKNNLKDRGKLEEIIYAKLNSTDNI